MRVIVALIFALALTATGPSASTAAPMTFKRAAAGATAPVGEWIAAEGEITDQTAEDFKAFLARERIRTDPAGNGLVVYLNSPGGSVRGGVRLGVVIRAAGFDTRVARTVSNKDDARYDVEAPGRCYSACALAFLGGRSRDAATRTLGILQTDLAGASGDPRTAETARLLAGYVARMGVDAQFLTPAGADKQQGVYLVRADEMMRFAITRRQ